MLICMEAVEGIEPSSSGLQPDPYTILVYCLIKSANLLPAFILQIEMNDNNFALVIGASEPDTIQDVLRALILEHTTIASCPLAKCTLHTKQFGIVSNLPTHLIRIRRFGLDFFLRRFSCTPLPSGFHT